MALIVLRRGFLEASGGGLVQDVHRYRDEIDREAESVVDLTTAVGEGVVIRPRDASLHSERLISFSEITGMSDDMFDGTTNQMGPEHLFADEYHPGDGLQGDDLKDLEDFLGASLDGFFEDDIVGVAFREGVVGEVSYFPVKAEQAVVSTGGGYLKEPKLAQG